MPGTHSVEITTNGARGQVLLDGTDISNRVRGLSFDTGVGETPRVILELILIDTSRISTVDTEVLVPDATAETLIALGWTPPAEQAATADAGEPPQP